MVNLTGTSAPHPRAAIGRALPAGLAAVLMTLALAADPAAAKSSRAGASAAPVASASSSTTSTKWKDSNGARARRPAYRCY